VYGYSGYGYSPAFIPPMAGDLLQHILHCIVFYVEDA